MFLLREIEMIILILMTHRHPLPVPHQHNPTHRVILHTTGIEALLLLPELTDFLACFHLMHIEIFARPQHHLSLELVEVDFVDGVFEVDTRVGVQATEGVGIVGNELVAPLIEYT
jgi:hypothetical protein